jgi:hypothetical protein
MMGGFGGATASADVDGCRRAPAEGMAMDASSRGSRMPTARKKKRKEGRRPEAAAAVLNFADTALWIGALNQ